MNAQLQQESLSSEVLDNLDYRADRRYLARFFLGCIRFCADHRRGLIGLLSVCFVLVCWQVFAVNHVLNPGFTSYPSQIAHTAVAFFGTPAALKDVSVSGKEYGLGILLGLAVAIPTGISVGWFKTFGAILDPFIVILNATPLIAIAPLFVLWFGIGIGSKVAIVFLVCLIPIVVITASGVRNIDPVLINVARVFRASNLQILRTIVLPACVPSLFAGVRLALGFGLVGVVVGEIIASSAGVGYLIEFAGNSFDTPLLFVGIGIVSMTGVVIATVLRAFERHLDRWRL